MKRNDRLRSVQAIIISHRDFSESDRLVKIFSLEHGKLTVLAKGVRKVKSRKSAYLEPFMHSKIVLARGHTFWIVTQADAVNNFMRIRDSLKKTSLAAEILELIDHLTIEDEPDQAIFHLIESTLAYLNQEEDVYTVMLYFKMRLLDQAGFRPDLFHCVDCKKEIQPQDQYFSFIQGGALCPECAKLHPAKRPISLETLRYLRHFQRSSYYKLKDVHVPDVYRQPIAYLLQDYFSHIAERKLHAPDFMRQVLDDGDV